MPYIYIDSSKRINKKNTKWNDFYITFNEWIIIKKYIKLLSIIIPKTVYLVNANNNTFIIKFADNTIINVNIAINNYDTNTLAIMIKSLIQYGNFDIVFDENKFEYTLWANQNFTLTFTSDFYRLFNYENELYTSNNNILKSNNINFNSPMMLKIDIKNIENTYISDNNLNCNFILGFFCERFGLFSYTISQYEQTNPVYKEYKINTFNIWIYDENNKLIDLNNNDYYMIFEFN